MMGLSSRNQIEPTLPVATTAAVVEREDDLASHVSGSNFSWLQRSNRDGSASKLADSFVKAQDDEEANEVKRSWCLEKIHYLRTLDQSTTRITQMIIVLLLPGLILTISSAIGLANPLSDLLKTQAADTLVEDALRISELAHKLQAERGVSAFFVSSKDDPTLVSFVEQRYNGTNGALYDVTDEQYSEIGKFSFELSKISSVYVEKKYMFGSQANMAKKLQEHRDQLSWKTSSIRREIEYYDFIIKTLLEFIDYKFRQVLTNSQALQPLNSHVDMLVSLMKAENEYGKERAFGSVFYGQGGYKTNDELKFYYNMRLNGELFTNEAMYGHIEEGDVDVRQLVLAWEYTETFHVIKEMREEILHNNRTTVSVQLGSDWFQYMTELIGHLHLIRVDLARDIQKKTHELVVAAVQDLIFGVVIIALVCISSPLVIRAIFRSMKVLKMFENRVKLKGVELKQEKDRCDEILAKLLPKFIANKMVSGGIIVPDVFDNVTIYFSDIVGFTEICSKEIPVNVVSFLNNLYNTFDQVAEEYEVYKIGTIGDAYMVSSGAPYPCNTHAVEIARMSISMMAHASRITVKKGSKTHVKIRSGVHSGGCAAGVVGLSMPRYTLFGDTVTIAARMESTGQPMRIQISSTTWELLQKTTEFVTSPRPQLVEIENSKDGYSVGLMQTHWLKGCISSSKARAVWFDNKED